MSFDDTDVGIQQVWRRRNGGRRRLHGIGGSKVAQWQYQSQFSVGSNDKHHRHKSVDSPNYACQDEIGDRSPAANPPTNAPVQRLSPFHIDRSGIGQYYGRHRLVGSQNGLMIGCFLLPKLCDVRYFLKIDVPTKCEHLAPLSNAVRLWYT